MRLLFKHKSELYRLAEGLQYKKAYDYFKSNEKLIEQFFSDYAHEYNALVDDKAIELLEQLNIDLTTTDMLPYRDIPNNLTVYKQYLYQTKGWNIGITLPIKITRLARRDRAPELFCFTNEKYKEFVSYASCSNWETTQAYRSLIDEANTLEELLLVWPEAAQVNFAKHKIENRIDKKAIRLIAKDMLLRTEQQ